MIVDAIFLVRRAALRFSDGARARRRHEAVPLLLGEDTIDDRAGLLDPRTGPHTRGNILSWALDAQAAGPTPSHTTGHDASVDALDDGQHDAAGAVAGHDRLVLVVGSAGGGKTRMLQAADLEARLFIDGDPFDTR